MIGTDDDVVYVSHYANTSSITARASLSTHQVLGVENVIDIDEVGHGGLDAGDVAGALDDDLVLGGGDHQSLAVSLHGGQERAEVLGLDGVHLDGVDDDDARRQPPWRTERTS